MISIAQLIALTYALIAIVKRRFRLGIACLAASAYLVLAMATSLPGSGPVLLVNFPGVPLVWNAGSAPNAARALLPGGAALVEAPIIFALISVALSVAPLVVAWRRADAERPDLETEKSYKPIVHALIAVAVIDTISLVILTFASMLSSPY